MRNYSKLLKEAHEQNLDISALDMAYEMECCLDQEVSEEHFDILCSYAFTLWLKFGYSKGQCANAVIAAYNDNTFEHFKSLDKYQLAGYVKI